jgi:hypothetical protein
MKFPKTIYITQEKSEGLDPYLVADATTDSVENRSKVGVYELREIKTKRVDHRLE